ncbi:hypothetical protein ASG31_00585 [Chryseobacterium sp. Leaf404]|uniref:hypothetical protein n=1 Tax=unclassified Chryseobacterium TaxID=2593645 RepID=UPI0006F7B16D|nr:MULTISPECIES: hypothetical protein [unclassified Chryseobacterium]KQT21875.1 hypothetical protein ASG31_00585 [Chryseobacterium sp. Leaf404]
MKKLILSLALVGFGSLAMAQQNVTPEQREAKRAEMQQKMQQREKDHLDKMQKDLNLSKDQVAKIKNLQDQKRAERKADFDRNKDARMAKMKEMKDKRAQMDQEMKKILSPDQYTKWEADRKAKMEQRKMAMKDRKNKGAGSHHKPMNTAVEPLK